MLAFKVVPEKTYYSLSNYNKKLERISYVNNTYRLCYYIADNNVYAYYHGKYMKATISSKMDIEEIDLIDLIISESKRLKVAEEEIELD